MGEVDMVALGKATQFKPGNTAGKGQDHRLQALLQSKRFKEKCREFLLNPNEGLVSGEEPGGFAILKRMALAMMPGYDGRMPNGEKIKPPDVLAAITLMAKAGGELKENITVERVDPLQDVRDEELLDMARESVKVLEAKRADSDGRGSGETSGSVGDAGAKKD